MEGGKLHLRVPRNFKPVILGGPRVKVFHILFYILQVSIHNSLSSLYHFIYQTCVCECMFNKIRKKKIKIIPVFANFCSNCRSSSNNIIQLRLHRLYKCIDQQTEWTPLSQNGFPSGSSCQDPSSILTWIRVLTSSG